MITKEKIDKAMIDLTSEAKNIYGSKLKEVILYGSCARGDFTEESDVDVMILLDVPVGLVKKESVKIDAIISKLDIKYDYDLLLTALVRSYEDFSSWENYKPFYKNIRKEGIRYA